MMHGQYMLKHQVRQPRLWYSIQDPSPGGSTGDPTSCIIQLVSSLTQNISQHTSLQTSRHLITPTNRFSPDHVPNWDTCVIISSQLEAVADSLHVQPPESISSYMWHYDVEILQHTNIFLYLYSNMISNNRIYTYCDRLMSNSCWDLQLHV